MDQPLFCVRPASEADVASIYNLILELAHYEKAPQEVINTEHHLLLHGFKNNPPLYYAWVAEMENKGVVGMALCYIRYSTWKGPVLYLEDIVVAEQHRHKGIGKALFSACKDFALQNGFKRMTWQVLDWNNPAILFYQKAGADFDNGWLNASIDFND